MCTKKTYYTDKYSSIYRKTLGIISIAFLFLFLASCNNSVDPTELDYHNKILFTSSRSGKEQLYMMNPDGTDIKQITSGEFSHSAGRWAPDASKIICNTDQNITTAGLQMVILNSDGTNRRLLGMGSQMCWSPEGSKIAFALMPRAELGDISTYIYVMNSDGTNIGQITNNLAVKDDTPSWSRDGIKIAFSSNRDNLSTFKSEVYIMNIDGTNQHRLTYTGISSSSPQWSPDGNIISFVSNGICLINKDGSNLVQVIADKIGFGVYRLPRWAPNGEQLIITWISSDGNAIKNIYNIKNNGEDLKKILDDQTAYATDWSK